jgi:macrolide transport system ATP-binding/permease protein
MVGIPIALMGARMMENQLYLVRSYDPWSLAVAILALAGAVAVAGFVPARRAASIDPMRALRNE